MTKWLIVSDNHRDKHVIDDLANIYGETCDALIHCGDSEIPANDKVWSHYYVVKGNNDFGQDYQKQIVTNIDGKKVFITHGDQYGVNQSRLALATAAKVENADFVFYGHTHKPLVERIAGIWVINPGSIYAPRQIDGIKTYLIVSFPAANTVTLQYYDDSYHPLTGKDYQYEINL